MCTHTHTLTEENVAVVEELTVSQEDTVHKSWRKPTVMHSRQICCRRTAMASMQLTTSFWGTWFSNESKVQDVNDLMQHLRRRAGRGAVGAERVARMSRESVPSPQGKGIHFDVCWRTFLQEAQLMLTTRSTLTRPCRISDGLTAHTTLTKAIKYSNI